MADTLCAQSLLQFDIDRLETLHDFVLLSGSANVHVFDRAIR